MQQRETMPPENYGRIISIEDMVMAIDVQNRNIHVRRKDKQE